MNNSIDMVNLESPRRLGKDLVVEPAREEEGEKPGQSRSASKDKSDGFKQETSHIVAYRKGPVFSVMTNKAIVKPTDDEDVFYNALSLSSEITQ